MSGWRVLVKKPCMHQRPVLVPSVSNPRNRTCNGRSSSRTCRRGIVNFLNDLGVSIRTGCGYVFDRSYKPMRFTCTMLIRHSGEDDERGPSHRCVARPGGRRAPAFSKPVLQVCARFCSPAPGAGRSVKVFPAWSGGKRRAI